MCLLWLQICSPRKPPHQPLGGEKEAAAIIHHDRSRTEITAGPDHAGPVFLWKGPNPEILA